MANHHRKCHRHLSAFGALFAFGVGEKVLRAACGGIIAASAWQRVNHRMSRAVCRQAEVRARIFSPRRALGIINMYRAKSLAQHVVPYARPAGMLHMPQQLAAGKQQ